MKQWFRGGANNTPHHASGTRATDRALSRIPALSHTRSLTAGSRGRHDGYRSRHRPPPHLQRQS